MTRVLLGLLGLAAMLVGAVHLLALHLADLADTALWLGGGVVAHDLLLAPAVVLLGVVATRRVPAAWRPALTVAGVLTGTLVAATLPTVVRQPSLALWYPVAGALAMLAALVVVPPRRRRRDA